MVSVFTVTSKRVLKRLLSLRFFLLYLCIHLIIYAASFGAIWVLELCFITVDHPLLQLRLRTLT